MKTVEEAMQESAAKHEARLVRFVQIATANPFEKDETRLLGLTAEGDVWRFDHNYGNWVPLPMWKAGR